MALNSQLLTVQIWTNDVQVLILCLSYLITSVKLEWPAWGKTNGNRIFLWFLVIFLKNAGWIGCKTLYALFMQFYNWPFYTCRIPNQLIQLLLLMMLKKKLGPQTQFTTGSNHFCSRILEFEEKKTEFSWDSFCPLWSLLKLKSNLLKFGLFEKHT